MNLPRSPLLPPSPIARPSRLPSPTAELAPAVALIAALFLGAVPSSAGGIDPNASREAFEAFHRRFATSAYAYPGHGAKPLGLAGFEIYVESAVDTGFGDDEAIASAIDGDFTADLLLVGRAGIRKGLPAGFDVGVSYAKSLDGDFDLFSAELQWATLDGSAVTPAFAFRATYQTSVDARIYDLDQVGVEALVSKGFAVLTPYAGAGVVRSEGGFEPVSGGRFGDTTTETVVYGGLTFRLLLPKLNFEVRRGEEVTASVRLSFGF